LDITLYDHNNYKSKPLTQKTSNRTSFFIKDILGNKA
jgi:hypothetical protein